jgi:hypothetical protein
VPLVVWALSFAVQLAAVPMALEVGSRYLRSALREAALPYAGLDFVVKVLQTLAPDILGVALGYLMTVLPAAVREPGRWIFVIPVVSYPVLAACSYFLNLHDLLFAAFGVRGAEYEGFGVIGLIFPAAGICLYSIGVRAGDRHTHPLANVFVDEDAIPDRGPRMARRKKLADGLSPKDVEEQPLDIPE